MRSMRGGDKIVRIYRIPQQSSYLREAKKLNLGRRKRFAMDRSELTCCAYPEVGEGIEGLLGNDERGQLLLLLTIHDLSTSSSIASSNAAQTPHVVSATRRPTPP
jgi:hypothetical protein